MINPTLIWFLCLPILVGLCLWYVRRNERDSWQPAAINTGIGILVIAASFGISSGVATMDVEIWNGKITAKDRIHDTYEQSYSCNCRSVSSGSGQNATSTTVCDTCYETHYTVKWTCNSTVGSWEISKLDSTRRSVYASPDPARWKAIQIGEPASRRHNYTNYVQAVPQSLFTPSSAGLKQKFAALIPAYPDNVYDVYRLNRFLTPGYSTPDAPLWNNDISMMLRELGPTKQVNTIVVIAKTDDPNYEYALRDAWEGANKNDVVLVIGSAQFPKIDFVRVLTWSKAENFKIELRDSVLALGTIQREPIIGLLQLQISKNFVRRQMREFKYLESEIDPPTWLLAVLAVIIPLGGLVTYGVVTGFFARNQKSRFTRR